MEDNLNQAIKIAAIITIVLIVVSATFLLVNRFMNKGTDNFPMINASLDSASVAVVERYTGLTVSGDEVIHAINEFAPKIVVCVMPTDFDVNNVIADISARSGVPTSNWDAKPKQNLFTYSEIKNIDMNKPYYFYGENRYEYIRDTAKKEGKPYININSSSTFKSALVYNEEGSPVFLYFYGIAG